MWVAHGPVRRYRLATVGPKHVGPRRLRWRLFHVIFHLSLLVATQIKKGMLTMGPLHAEITRIPMQSRTIRHLRVHTAAQYLI
jgi:hypothetical protein